MAKSKHDNYKTNKVYIDPMYKKSFPLSSIKIDERYIDMYTTTR